MNMTRRSWLQTIGSILLALALIGIAAPQPGKGRSFDPPIRLYVDKDATGAGNGSSWTDAYPQLQSALDRVNADRTAPYEIWVAEGPYYPDEGSGHANNVVSETFTLSRDNLQLYGGFVGTETLRSQRNWLTHPTILSGDIDKNDRNVDDNYINEVYTDTVGNNAWHVLYLDGTTDSFISRNTVIDGFTITGGDARSTGNINLSKGGGLYCTADGLARECSPTLSHLVVSGNQATYGGGIYNEARNNSLSNPLLTDVALSGNKATAWGGGMNCTAREGSTSNPALIDVAFRENSADSGGGMYVIAYNEAESSPQLLRVTFTGNRATKGGGLKIETSHMGISRISLREVAFDSNQATTFGGGIYLYPSFSSTAAPVLTQVTFLNNRAGSYGGAVSMVSYYEGINDLTMTDATLKNNQSNYGGGISLYTYQYGTNKLALTHVVLEGNQALYDGGGIYNNNYYSEKDEHRTVLADVKFLGNHAEQNGGGMYQNSGNKNAYTRLTYVTFSGNKADQDGAGLYWVTNTPESTFSMANGLFTGNQADRTGGGIYSSGTLTGTNQLKLSNVTLSGNWAGHRGGAITALTNTTLLMNNGLIWNNTASQNSSLYIQDATPVIAYSDIEGGYTGTNNLNVDPQFVAPIDPIAAPTTAGNYRLRSNSPIVNRGNNLSVEVSVDLDGRPRILDNQVDMGVYEFSRYLTVFKSGTGGGTVTSTPVGIDCGTVCLFEFPANQSVTLNATPLLSSTFAGWKGDIPTTTNPLIVPAGTTPHLIPVFTLKTFTITATAGSGGHILKEGAQTVNYDSRPGFLIRPKPNYIIRDVGVDGVPLGTVNSYTFAPVQADHTITATFSPISFTLTATPTVLKANGLDSSLLTVSLLDETGNGAPFAGQIVTLEWWRGAERSPLQLTLDEDGTARWTYTAGYIPDDDIITARWQNVGSTYECSQTIDLIESPLQGTLDMGFNAGLIVYTFTVKNNHAILPQTNLVISGSLPTGTELIGASAGLTFKEGGDYGAGYVETTMIPSLAPGSSRQIQWTVHPSMLNIYGPAQAHARSSNALLRLIAGQARPYGLYLPITLRNSQP